MESNNKRFSLNKNWELVNFCEFDQYATKSYCAIHNVDESLNLGDITKVDETKLEPFNMICGGSPCQDFSVAGKQKGSVWTCKDCGHEYNPLTVHWSKRDKCPCCDSENIEKTRSSLLVEYLRVIRANKPNFGMYENVKNIVGKQFRDTTFKLFEDELHEYGYNTYWKVLNAKDYGVPQNRERVYLIFIKKELDNGKFVFPEGFDNGIRLKDVLEDEVDEKYYFSDDKVQRFLKNIKLNEQHITDTPVRLGNVYGEQFGTGYAGNVWDKESIAPTLMTMQGGGRQPHIVCDIDKSTNKIKQIGKLSSSQDGVVVDPEGIAKTHTAGHNNTPKIIQFGIDKSINETKVIENANCLTAREDRGISNRKSEGTAILETPDTSYCLDANYYKGITPEQYIDKKRRQLVFENDSELCIRIRKLTPKECFRLMGFDDSAYDAASKVVSNSQLYKQTGNSIVVDVLYYILVELYKAMPYLFDDLRLSSFFSGIGAFEVALDRLYESINTGNFTNPQAE